MSRLDELLEQQRKIAAEVEAVRKEEKAEAIAQMKAMIAKFEVTADDLFGGTKPKRGRKADASTGTAAAKYRDPVSGKEWTGRGREPKWIVGKDRSQFAI